MKILILKATLLFFMTPIAIEDYLYKHISECPYTLDEQESYNDDVKSYTAKGKFDFFGRTYHYLKVNTNKNDTIQKFTLGIPGTINRPMYDQMVAKYGVPDEMTKKDKEIIGKPSTSANRITAIESTFTLKVCTFEEDPLFIVWNKEDFIIKIRCNQDKRMNAKYLYVEIGKVKHTNLKEKKQILKLFGKQ